MLKSYIYSVLLSFCSSFLLSAIYNHSLQLNDKIFLYGVIALLIGSILFVLRTGFFRLFLTGFNKIYTFAFKQASLMKNIDEQISKDLTFQRWKNQFSAKLMQYSLGAGTGCIVYSLTSINY